MKSEERRVNAIRYYHEVGTATKAAKKFGVSPQTIYNWVRAEKNNPALAAMRNKVEGEVNAQQAIQNGDERLHTETQRLEAENLRLTERLAAMTRLLSSYLSG